MRSTRIFSAFALAILIAQSAALAQSAKEPAKESADGARVLAMIRAAGYFYTDEGENKWKIRDQGTSFERIPIFLFILDDGSLVAQVSFSDEHRINIRPELKQKIKEWNRQFAPAEFIVKPDDHLLAVYKTPVKKLDGEKFKQIVEHMTEMMDKTITDILSFYGPSRKLDKSKSEPRKELIIPPTLQVPTDTPIRNDSGATSSVDSKPVLLNKVRPNYTIEARQNKVEGVVILRIVIDTKGSVEKVTVVRGLPDGLNEEAIAAANKLRFKPAMKDGKPVSFTMRVEVEFKLSDDK